MSKSQSALEYMMTYGWAILIIVIVAAVLYSLGIFSPSSSIGTTVTGFPGFQATAICVPNGVLAIKLANGIGYTVNVTGFNVTYNGKTIQNEQTGNVGLMGPDASATFFSLSACANASSSRYSSSVTVTYTEPGQTFPGPYFSSGAVSGTTSTFSQGTVANLTNGYIYTPASKSINAIWQSGHAYTLVEWVNLKSLGGNHNTYLIQEARGCTSGTALDQINISSSQLNTTDFTGFEVQWYGGADTCTSAGGIFVGNNGESATAPIIPYRQWVMITGIFKYNGVGVGWIAVCTDATCLNNTYTGSTQLPGGPANYSDPNQYINYIAGTGGLYGKVANIQMYSAALSASQVTELYDLGLSGIPIQSKNLVGWWPLDGNLNDYSGNGNTASSGGTVSFVSP